MLVLEHHADGTAVGRHVGDVLAGDHDPPVVGAEQTGDHAQQRALAAAGRTEERDDLGVGDVE